MRTWSSSRTHALMLLLAAIGVAGVGHAGCGGGSSSPADGGASGGPEGGEGTTDASPASDGAADAPDASPPDPNCANAAGVTDTTGDLGGNPLDAAFPFSEPGKDFLITAPYDGTGYNPLVGDIDLSFVSFVAGQHVQVDLVTLTVAGNVTTCSPTGCPAGMSVSVGNPPPTTITTSATGCGATATVPIGANGVLHLAVTHGALDVGIHVQLLPQ